MAWTFYNSNGEALVQHAESEATQAEMEAETAGAKFVPPDLVKNSPGVAKAWCAFNGESTIAITQSYNITDLTDNGTGDYSVNIATDLDATNYVAVATCQDDNVASQRARVNLNTTPMAEGVVGLNTCLDNGTTGVPANADMVMVCVAVFGTLP
jgi:hypothetical protein